MSGRGAKPKGFQCKQFFVAHDQCAMKVSTDSLILGSLVEVADARSVLDVGTGSGILALMLAQKSSPGTVITAIDIDQTAIAQASQNRLNSPWPDKISVVHSPLQAIEGLGRFDLIVSNPPYFADAVSPTRAYASMAENRGHARTEQTLSVEQFFAETALLSTAEGRLYCMYPITRKALVLDNALQCGWHLRHQMAVRHNACSAPYLGVYCFVRKPCEATADLLTIRAEDNQYTLEYKTLCADYYLNF